MPSVPSEKIVENGVTMPDSGRPESARVSVGVLPDPAPDAEFSPDMGAITEKNRFK